MNEDTSFILIAVMTFCWLVGFWLMLDSPVTDQESIGGCMAGVGIIILFFVTKANARGY